MKLSLAAKEEITKKIIDKLVLGVLASSILFGMQKCSNNYDRVKLQKEALFQIESQFIMEGLRSIKNEFSLYLFDVSSFISDGASLNSKQKSKLIIHRVKLESEIEVISAYNSSLKNDGIDLVRAMSSLNESLDSFRPEGSIDLINNNLSKLKENYRKLVGALKSAAIDSLSSDK